MSDGYRFSVVEQSSQADKDEAVRRYLEHRAAYRALVEIAARVMREEYPSGPEDDEGET